MVCPLSERASGASNLTAKNRVWGFFENSNRTRPANRCKPQQPRRKNRLTPTKTASGIPYWPSRDPIGEDGGINLYGFVYNNGVNYWDSFGLEAQKAEKSEETASSDCCCFKGDSKEPSTCHIWIYLSETKRERFGNLFVYNHCADLVFTTYVRAEGSRADRDPLKTNGNTPTGDYKGVIENPLPGGSDGSYGSNEVIRLTGAGAYINQPALAGQACNAQRPGILIHGGRQSQAGSSQVTIKVYDMKLGKWVEQKVDRIWNSNGCVRVDEDKQAELIKMVKSLKCCNEWIVHVREGDPNENFIKKQPPYVIIKDVKK